MKKPIELDGHLAEHQVDSAVVFSGTLLHVRKDTVALPNGAAATREYVVHPGAAMIVPRLPNGNLLVERQFRYPNRKVFLDFPAGKRDPGESSAATALRELEEETGYRAGKLAFLAPIHNAIAYSDEQIDLYFADDLTKTVQNLDAHEFVELTEMSLPAMLDGVRTGVITDVKTIIGVMWMEKIAAGAWPVRWLDLKAL
ncbi:MAG: NUDIX domain-containing protein [Burkholderiaceae bacterium]